MDKNGKDCNNVKTKPLVSVDSEKVEFNGERDKDNEAESLLPPRKGGLRKKGGGLSKKSGKPRRKVQWSDKIGNKLAEVLEFQPSDVSDSDDEDLDSCICTIM
ncbi:hypothetical protein ACSBR2_030872 [Camellia fascicularis]